MPAGALLSLLLWHEAALPGPAGTRVAQFTALSFDVSAQEILSTLAFGKTLVVPPDEIRRDAGQFARWLDLRQVEELFAPNLVVEALAEAALEQGLALPTLKDIAQAGGCTTITAPRKPMSPPATLCPLTWTPACRRPPSAGRSAGCGYMCWTRRRASRRRACRASCTSPGRAWRGAI